MGVFDSQDELEKILSEETSKETFYLSKKDNKLYQLIMYEYLLFIKFTVKKIKIVFISK